MIWLIIHRRSVRRPNGGVRVEIPGVIAGELDAPDRNTALGKCPRALPHERYDVVARASWNLMPNAERDRLLGNYTPPGETRSVVSLRAAYR